jgi:DNA polymerase-3 subunit alpha
LSFGGIITNVQHRVAKNGKGWATFVLEGYDESYEFKIFGEEYMKNRHYLIPNSFTYMKVLVKEGWADKETGKKGEPRLQFSEFKILQDVLGIFAKKLVVQLNINDLQADFIHRLSGDNTVTFEVLELEKIKRQVEVVPQIVAVSDEVVEDIVFDEENPQVPEMELVTEIEEIKVITKLEMPSRKLKIKISN